MKLDSMVINLHVNGAQFSLSRVGGHLVVRPTSDPKVALQRHHQQRVEHIFTSAEAYVKALAFTPRKGVLSNA